MSCLFTFDNNQCLIRFLFTIHMFWLIGKKSVFRFFRSTVLDTLRWSVIHIENRKNYTFISTSLFRDECKCSFFSYFQYVLVNWIYKSRVALLEQINVLRHQVEVFVALNSHKSSLFLCELVIHFIDVRFLFQYAVGLGLRGCYTSGSGGLVRPD